MSKLYLISIGGTGARSLEATIYLAAAGLFDEPIQVLMIDPDQGNGNINRTTELLPLYHQLHMCGFPAGQNQVKRKVIWSQTRKQIEEKERVLFRSAINKHRDIPLQQEPFLWKDANRADMRFSDAIGYASLSEKFKDFVNLFYERTDLDMELGKGYRGRPNVGAVTLTLSFMRAGTLIAENKQKIEGVSSFLKSLKEDLNFSNVKVFVFGSVFGGTGAAGLPIIPKLIRKLCDNNTANLKFGCALMAPYFTFQKATKPIVEGPAPDPDRHMVATQTALQHYAQSLSDYNNTYLLGAPSLTETSQYHREGGSEQCNEAHYIEMVAALAARDFSAINAGEHQLHYLDGEQVSWQTLPGLKDLSEDRNLIMHRLLAFTTLAYCFKHILNDELKNHFNDRWYVNSSLSLNTANEQLAVLNTFCGNYLTWLRSIGKSLDKNDDALFNWPALMPAQHPQAKQAISQLMKSAIPPHYENGYEEIIRRMNTIMVERNSPITQCDSVGTLLYLLYTNISEFCQKNYSYELKNASSY